jgi:hypothetical protein
LPLKCSYGFQRPGTYCSALYKGTTALVPINAVIVQVKTARFSMSGNPTNRELRIFSRKFFYKISINSACRLRYPQQPREGQSVTLRKYSKHLPWALPAMVFLFDLVDMQWMFSHEPGLSYEVVRRFQLLLLPGTLFFSPLPAILFNCGIAALVGAIAFLVAGRRS